jgi:hypothetical protein
MPRALELLFGWIESNGLFIDTDEGQRIGFLSPQDELESKWTDTERPGGTIIEFFAKGNINLKDWFGHDTPEVMVECVSLRKLVLMGRGQLFG